MSLSYTGITNGSFLKRSIASRWNVYGNTMWKNANKDLGCFPIKIPAKMHFSLTDFPGMEEEAGVNFKPDTV